MRNYFSMYTAENILQVDLNDSKQFPDFVLGRGTVCIDGIYYPTDIYGNILTEEQKKEERFRIKRDYYQRLIELDLIENTPEVQAEMGIGYFRENKGYNKYGEWCCNKCHIHKPRTVEYFPKDIHRRDGLGYTCRECLKEYSKTRYYSKIKPKNE